MVMSPRRRAPRPAPRSGAGRCARLALLAAALLASPAARPVTVEDDRGASVTLEAPARRVVSLAPFITELVYAAGAGDRLVGVSMHSDYPPAAADLPQVGDAFSVKLEALLAARPDLVMSWQSGNNPRVRKRLRSMGVPVFVLEPRDLDDIPRALRRIGSLLGTGETAAAEADAFTRRIEEIRGRYADRPTVRVFYQISGEPLMTLNGQHMVTALLGLCGGVNVFGELSPIAPTVNREQVLARDPEAILISSATGPEPLDAWSRYASITAVRLGNVFTVSAELINRQTPRLVEGASQICERLERARENLEGL